MPDALGDGTYPHASLVPLPAPTEADVCCGFTCAVDGDGDADVDEPAAKTPVAFLDAVADDDGCCCFKLPVLRWATISSAFSFVAD